MSLRLLAASQNILWVSKSSEQTNHNIESREIRDLKIRSLRKHPFSQAIRSEDGLLPLQLNYGSVNEIPWCKHSSKTALEALSQDPNFSSVFYQTECWNFSSNFYLGYSLQWICLVHHRNSFYKPDFLDATYGNIGKEFSESIQDKPLLLSFVREIMQTDNPINY